MNLALEVDLLPLWVTAGCEMNGGHVQTEVALSNGLHVADQVRMSISQSLVPHHYRIVIVLQQKSNVHR